MYNLNLQKQHKYNNMKRLTNTINEAAIIKVSSPKITNQVDNYSKYNTNKHNS